MDQVFANNSSHVFLIVRDMAQNGLSAAWLVKPGTFIKPSNIDSENTFWKEDCFNEYSDLTVDLAAKTLEVY